MRAHLLLVILLIPLVVSACSEGSAAPRAGSAAPATEGPLDALGRRVFRALGAKDRKVLESLRAERQDLEACIERRARSLANEAEAATLRRKGKEELERRFAPERVIRFRAKQAKNFTETLAAADWSRAVLLGIEYEVDVEVVAQLRRARIGLVMRLEGKGVKVQIDDLVETPRGWLTVEDNPLRVRME